MHVSDVDSHVLKSKGVDVEDAQSLEPRPEHSVTTSDVANTNSIENCKSFRDFCR